MATALLMMAIPGFLLGDSDIAAHDFFWVASWLIGIPGLVLSLVTGAGYLAKIRGGVAALRLRA